MYKSFQRFDRINQQLGEERIRQEEQQHSTIQEVDNTTANPDINVAQREMNMFFTIKMTLKFTPSKCSNHGCGVQIT